MLFKKKCFFGRAQYLSFACGGLHVLSNNFELNRYMINNRVMRKTKMLIKILIKINHHLLKMLKNQMKIQMQLVVVEKMLVMQMMDKQQIHSRLRGMKFNQPLRSIIEKEALNNYPKLIYLIRYLDHFLPKSLLKQKL